MPGSEPDDEEASGYVGVMQAIISIFADERDRLRCVLRSLLALFAEAMVFRYVDAGEDRIAFLLKAPIYLVCSSNWGEPEAIVRGLAVCKTLLVAEAMHSFGITWTTFICRFSV